MHFLVMTLKRIPYIVEFFGHGLSSCFLVPLSRQFDIFSVGLPRFLLKGMEHMHGIGEFGDVNAAKLSLASFILRDSENTNLP